MEKFGDRLKTLRIENGLTQEEFGRIFGVSKYSVSLYENNKNLPSDDVKKKIAQHFNISIDWLMGISNARVPEISQSDKDDSEIIEVCRQLQNSNEGRALIKQIKGMSSAEIKKINRIVEVIKEAFFKTEK